MVPNVQKKKMEYICMDYPLDGYRRNWLTIAASREGNWGQHNEGGRKLTF